MKDALTKLIKVKTLVTLFLTALFIILAIYGVISGDDVVKIYMVIIAFYFGTQVEKKEG